MRAISFAVALLSVLLLFLDAGAASAQPKLPGRVEVPVGRLAAVPITGAGKLTDWRIIGRTANVRGEPIVDWFREYDPDPNIVRIRVVGYEPTQIWIVVAVDGKLFDTEILIGAPPPPGPGPVPPPPGPDPVPPDPPLVQALKAAYAADPSPAKAQQLNAYRTIIANAPNIALQPDLKTNADLIARLHAECEQQVGRGQLQGVRRVIGDEINRTFGSTVKTLSPALRDQYAAEFRRLTAALSQVK